MSQLWQSIAITIALGGVMLAGSLFVAARNDQPVEPITELPAAPTQQLASVSAFMGLGLTGQSALVFDIATGEVLYSENADAQLPLASLTKLLTVYAAQTVLSPNDPVRISSSSLAAEGESGFNDGESFPFADLASYTLVTSSNDAAEAIAEAAATELGVGKEELMRRAAARAGLSSTHAVNGSGLDLNMIESGGYGTARDVAKLAAALLQESPDIVRTSALSSITVYSDAGIPYSQRNTNPYTTTMPGLLLSKTGFTDLAGGNLVVVFDAGVGHPIAVVVLGSSRVGRFTDVEMLISATRAHFAGFESI